jgi:hypothetical protein
MGSGVDGYLGLSHGENSPSPPFLRERLVGTSQPGTEGAPPKARVCRDLVGFAGYGRYEFIINLHLVCENEGGLLSFIGTDSVFDYGGELERSILHNI